MCLLANHHKSIANHHKSIANQTYYRQFMNSNFMLQNYIENGNDPIKVKKTQKNANSHQQAELSIAILFNEVTQLLEDHQSVAIKIPTNVTKATEKLDLIKAIIIELLERKTSSSHKNDQIDQSGVISCEDCQNYEASLQKLQNQVRQHIRLEQQLKIFQDTMEEKIDEFKKEKKDYQKKIQSQKKQIDDVKSLATNFNEKMNKMETENERLKTEIKQLKMVQVNNEHPLSTKRQNRGTYNGYESKENKMDWHRHVSIKKDEKEKVHERKSVEKRNDSGEKWRMSAANATKSTKMISLMNEKLVQEKTKDERRKIIQSKFENRK